MTTTFSQSFAYIPLPEPAGPWPATPDATITRIANHVEIAQSRRGIQDILARFSFALGDGVRWMPDSARPHFDAAVKIMDVAARADLSEALSLPGPAPGNSTNISELEPHHVATSALPHQASLPGQVGSPRSPEADAADAPEAQAVPNRAEPSSGGVDGYLNSQRDRIIEEANSLFHEFDSGDVAAEYLNEHARLPPGSPQGFRRAAALRPIDS